MNTERKKEIEATKKGWFHPFTNDVPDEYDPYKNPNSTFSITDIFTGFPLFDNADLPEEASFWEYLVYYKYLINVFAISFPWFLFAAFCVVWNLYFNIKWNRFWAGGNIYLIMSTLFLMSQAF